MIRHITPDECEGPDQSGAFDDPTYYCPVSGRAVDDEDCAECQEGYSNHVDRQIDARQERLWTT